MGLAKYGGSYILNLATLTDPLWNLFKQESFEWTNEHEKAIQDVKQAVIQHALSLFNSNWHIEITVDASPCGLGAVLGQINPERRNDKKTFQVKDYHK